MRHDHYFTTVPPASADGAERALWERDGLPPAWAVLERKYLMAVHSFGCVPKLAFRTRTPKPPPEPRIPLGRPVVSDRGERFASAKAASVAMGCGPSAVRSCIGTGTKCGGRKWAYDTPMERRGRPGKPVVSDRGEMFPSATAAAIALGVSVSAVRDAMSKDYRCVGRKWKQVAA